jgi:hypothetical protein
VLLPIDVREDRYVTLQQSDVDAAVRGAAAVGSGQFMLSSDGCGDANGIIAFATLPSNAGE